MAHCLKLYLDIHTFKNGVYLQVESASVNSKTVIPTANVSDFMFPKLQH